MWHVVKVSYFPVVPSLLTNYYTQQNISVLPSKIFIVTLYCSETTGFRLPGTRQHLVYYSVLPPSGITDFSQTVNKYTNRSALQKTS